MNIILLRYLMEMPSVFSSGGDEGNKKPDFIFPSGEAYHNSSFDIQKLVTLAAKTTCKDRWRQVLNEANRLKDSPKYLCTLQQGISGAQMDEMQAENVVLVVPEPYIVSYPKDRRDRIWTIARFVKYIQKSRDNMDIKSPEERSKNMAAIHSKNTKPEIYLRKLLFARGYRYGVNSKSVPGHPDIYMRKYNTAIFATWVFLAQATRDANMLNMPKSRVEFWQKKFDANIKRDEYVRKELMRKKSK